MNSEKQYIDIFQQFRTAIDSHSSDAMNAARDAAFGRFRTNGLPTRKAERYKYTDLQQLFAPDYGLNLNRVPIPVDPYRAFRCDVPNLSTSLYFVVNDAFHHDERTPAARLPEGVVVGSLRELTRQPASPAAQRYNTLAGKSGDAVSDLNTMLAQDGLYVYVPRNVKVDRAIQVINILKSPFTPAGSGRTAATAAQQSATTAQQSAEASEWEGALMVHRRVLIIVEPGAELKMLFCDHTADDRHFLATQVIEAVVGEGATLDLYCLEETHHKNVRVSNVYVEQQRYSRVNHNVITLHNGVTRNALDLVLAGEGAECACYGCVIADKHQHVDNNTLITHRASHCTSGELYKYVLDEQATGAFAGRVLVEQGAQKTTSQMTNQNLTATREARMFTQPMLEIYADDVKCAHGSTVGQLNDAALFYMRQRGISLAEAKLLLQNAFVDEVIDKMQLEPLRDRLHYLVEKRFRGELNKCRGCQLCK